MTKRETNRKEVIIIKLVVKKVRHTWSLEVKSLNICYYFWEGSAENTLICTLVHTGLETQTKLQAPDSWSCWPPDLGSSDSLSILHRSFPKIINFFH